MAMNTRWWILLAYLLRPEAAIGLGLAYYLVIRLAKRAGFLAGWRTELAVFAFFIIMGVLEWTLSRHGLHRPYGELRQRRKSLCFWIAASAVLLGAHALL